MFRPFSSADIRIPRPADGGDHWPGAQPPFIPTPSVGPNSSLLGPPGPAAPGPPSVSVPPRPLPPPASHARPEVPSPSRPLRPQYMQGPAISDRPMGAPRLPVPGAMVGTPIPVRQPVPPPVSIRSDGAPDMSSKVVSYMRPNPNGSSEVMFDAYALFSRGDDRTRSIHGRQCPPPPVKPSERTRFGRLGARCAGRKEKKSKSGGRKLSAIADFLGVNEPPPAAPKTVSSDIQVPPQSTSVSSLVPPPPPACVSTIPYLVSIPSLTQNTMSPISLYIPQMSSFRMPTFHPPTAPLTPGMMSAPGLSPAMLPTITYKSNSSILGAPANLDEFIRKLRTA